MGQINIISGASFPSRIPKVAIVDGIESSGSLLLVEPGHSSNPWAGVPSTGSRVPNLLRSTANAVTGKSTADGALVHSFVAGKGVVERTAKGGLHVITKPTAALASDSSLTIKIPDAVADHISTNYSHRYFVSIWARTTAAKQSAISNPAIPIMGLQSQTAFGMELRNTSPGARAAVNVNSPYNYADAVGNYRLNAEVTTLPSNLGAAPFFVQNLLQAGNAMTGTVADFGKMGSYIFYRGYIEDLTVSGRTYAQCNDLDAALHAQAFGSGGRYAGDTFTAP